MMRDIVAGSPKAAIDKVLLEKIPHLIVSMSLASSEEFNTAGIVLLVIEYLPELFFDPRHHFSELFSHHFDLVLIC